MTLANFEIVEIMSWSDFDCASTIFWVSMLISNNRDFTVSKREVNCGANSIFITLIFWINRYCGITEKCFGTSGRNNDVVVGNIPKCARFIFVLNYNICEGCAMFRAVIDLESAYKVFSWKGNMKYLLLGY